MKRAGLIAIAALGASCSPPTNLLPVNDFNRPTDVAFMCFGAFQQGAATADGGTAGAWQVTGRPMQACHPQDQYDPGATTQTRTFAFMPNSAAGTLSAIDADHWKLLDLNVDTGGYGAAPLGQLPEQISASDDGCQLISANRGSCDLTLVNPSVLVASTFQQETGGAVMPPSPRATSHTFRPIKGDGTLLTAQPYEAVFLPQDTSSLLSAPPTGAQPLPIQPAQLQMCGDSAAVDPVGWPAQPGPKSWYVLVTYPSCDLITLVALPSGRIVSSARVQATKDSDGNKTGVELVDAGTSPVCSSANCAGQALPPSSGATSDAALRSDAAGTVDAQPPAQPEAGASDGAATVSDAGAGTGGTGGSAGTGGATSTGGTPGTGGASGADAGATGGSLGNQYPNVPYVGPGPSAPSGIAILPDASRAYVSLANASYVLSVGLTSSGLTLPANAIYLNEGARGSSRVRLSVEPNRTNITGTAGVFVGSDSAISGESANGPPNFAGLDPNRRYLYAIARDGTLRVIQVANPGAETECETNADPLHLAPGTSASSPCIPIDPVNAAAHRRPFSIGPGIHFPSLPIDVAAADIQNIPFSTNEETVNGAYAWVITDSGIVYLVNINPILRDYNASVSTSKVPYVFGQVTETPPFVNTLRDRNEITYSLTLDPSSGPPRVDVLPSTPATGPYIEPFWTQGSILNATAVSPTYVQTVAFFPQEPPSPSNVNDPIDRRAITAQTWTVAWQGPLSGVRNSGHPLASDLGVTSFTGAGSGVLKTDSLFQDGGVNYCAMGVVPGDLVTLTGCTDKGQCGLGEDCAFGDGVSTAAAGLTVTGICVDPNRASAQKSLCTDFLNSVRRYEVESAGQNDLVIRPHLDEIVMSSLTPCHPEIPASGTTPASADSCPDPVNDLTSAKFRCLSIYPGGGTEPRCLMPCALSSDCRAGRLCVDFDAARTVPPFCARQPDGGTTGTASDCACKGPSCFCADAPPFDHTGKACFDQLVNYQVNAGKSFLVAGSQSGFVNTAPLPGSPGNKGPNCDANPPSDPRFSFRIPMSAPTCPNATADLATIDSRLDPDAFTGDEMKIVANGASKLVSFVLSTPSPDPCLYVGGPTAGDPTRPPAGVDAGAGADGGVATDQRTHVRALFQNSQMNFVLANVDRSPTSQFITSFDVHGGFAPQVVQDPITVEVSMPARIVVGPADSLAQVTTGTPTPPAYEVPYLFVVDQHRLGREQGGGPTRGQLLRINPLGYAVTVGSTPTGYQPIFEDYNASGGLFPIQ
jgi:hypothetical protein